MMQRTLLRAGQVGYLHFRRLGRTTKSISPSYFEQSVEIDIHEVHVCIVLVVVEGQGLRAARRGLAMLRKRKVH